MNGLALRAALTAALAAGIGVLGILLAWQADSAIEAWAFGLAAIAIAAAMGYLAFMGMGEAVHDVSVAARRLAEGELGQRVTVGSGPAAELTESFNSMARQVQQLLQTIAADHARIEAVFDASTDAMVAMARDTTVRFVNPAALELLGESGELGHQRPFIELARDYELDALVRRAIINVGAETKVITFGQRRVPLRAVAVPIPNGGDWAVLLMLTDLTEVNRVDSVRRDFLTNVSHELRTPLASIRALVETLESGSVDPGDETEEFLKRIRQQVERLTTLVNELLDLSRIESGAIELRPQPIDLADLVAEAASLMRQRAEEAGVRVESPAHDGAVVEGDHTSLLRVVSNLLDNALKYSPPGSTIAVETHDEGELVALSVRDQGAGISDHDLPRVFERFYKGDPSRANSGVGLGLAIVKHVVRVHGGTVHAHSQPGCGATFTVRLPRKFVGVRPAALR